MFAPSGEKMRDLYRKADMMTLHDLKQQWVDLTILAAAVDVMTYRGVLNPRSIVNDARLATL